MAKKVLKVSYDYNLILIGIVTTLSDYRFCWFLNKHSGFDFIKSDDLILENPNGSDSFYTRYESESQPGEPHYILIANKGNPTHFLPEKKELDFLLVVKDAQQKNDFQTKLISKIRSTELIDAVLGIELSTLKSRDNFIML